MVVHVAADRGAAAPADGAGVERGGDPQLEALRPERVVVVRAVDAVHVEPQGVARQLRVAIRDHAGRPLHVAGEEHRLEAEHVDRVLELLDRLGGGVHGDRRDRRETVGELTERVGVVAVERPARATTDALVLEVKEHEADAGIDHGEVEADLVEPLVEQLGEHRGGEVARVAHRRAPEGGTRHAPVRPLGRGQPVPRRRRPEGAWEQVAQCRLAGVDALLAEITGQRREVLDVVAVDVDDGVAETFSYGGRSRRRHRGGLYGRRSRWGHRRPDDTPTSLIASFGWAPSTVASRW